jgi:hypothetical protein
MVGYDYATGKLLFCQPACWARPEGHFDLSAKIYQPKWEFISQLFISQNLSAKIYQPIIYKPNEKVISQTGILSAKVGIFISQTPGWLASKARCELVKSLHSKNAGRLAYIISYMSI